MDNPRPDDKTMILVKEARSGNQDAIAALYQLYKDRLGEAIHSKIGRHLRSRLETVDLIQTVWKDVLGDIERFEYQGSESFFRWLLTRLIHKIKDKGKYFGAAKRDIKKELRICGEDSQSVGAPPPPANDRSPSQIAESNEQFERLMRLLDQLPDLQREALVLRMKDGLKFEEIGRTMGRSTDAAKKLVSRALIKIDEIIASEKQNDSI